MTPSPPPHPLRIARLAVGSRNAGNLQAVAQALSDPAVAAMAVVREVAGFEVPSGVRASPVGFEETMTGAANRARAAAAAGGAGRDEGDGTVWGLGIESGAVRLRPGDPTMFHFDAACVFDPVGGRECFGVSSLFEYPRPLSDAFDRGEDFQAARRYISDDPLLPQKGGVIALLSGGVTDRIITATQAVRLALARAADPLGKY